MPRCQYIEVLSVLTSNRKEVLLFLTSHCKEVLVPCMIQEQATGRSRKKLPFLHTWYTHGTHTWYTRIADENENRAYRANRYDNTQNRFEYRRKRSIGTSSALARNETRLV